MQRSTKFILGSVAVGVAIALIWFRAPVMPALAGALGAGFILFWRQRSALQ